MGLLSSGVSLRFYSFLSGSQQNLEDHSRVLADPLWKIDRETAFQYLNLAARTDNYVRVSVQLFPDNSPFITIENTLTSPLESFFIMIRFYRTVLLEQLVISHNEEIALITVQVVNRNALLYVIEFFLMFFFASLFTKILLFVKEKQSLENKILLTEGYFRDSENKFKNLVDNIPGISYRCLPNKNWTMIFISNEVENITGYPSTDFINDKNLSFYSIIDSEDTSRVYKTVAAALAKRIPFMVEYTLFCKDGSTRLIYDRGRGIFDEEGSVLYIDGVLIDITEQKKIKDQKDLLELQFYQAQKMESVGRLAGGIAHDFNNLLTPILGFSDLILLEAREKGLTLEYVEEVIHTAERAKELIHQLLSYSRKQTLKYDSFSLNSLIQSFEILLKGTLTDNINLQLDLDQELPDIWADQGQLEQIIMNLTVNARDAMPEGGSLTIKTTADLSHKYGTAPSFVSLYITDTGIGMDWETQNKIFEPFYSTKGQLGSGLGLATVFGIINQLKGRISVDSKLGKGTIFRIDLPVAMKEDHYED